MKISVHLFREIITFTMPVAGTITKLPEEGEISPFVPDSIDQYPDQFFGTHRIKKGESSTQIHFDTNIFREQYLQLGRDVVERKESLDQFCKQFDGTLSTQPSEDPFLVIQHRDVDRINNAYSLLVTLLWSEDIANLSSNIPNEKFPVLENRIGNLLSQTAILLCASLLVISENDTRRLATFALAQEIRRKEGVPHLEGIVHYEVEHPSAPIQTLNINDPVLYMRQTVTSSVEAFHSAYTKFDNLARSYWESIGEKKLYTLRDISALRQWKVIRENIMPGLLAEDNSITPLQKLDKALTEWLSTKSTIEQHYRMAQEIGSIGMHNWINEEWPPLDQVAFDERGAWLARTAAENLGLPPEMADGHILTWKRLGDYLLKYMLLDFQSPTGMLPGVNERIVFESLAESAVPQAVNHLVSTQMEFSMVNVYGGTKLRLNKTAVPTDLENEFLVRDIGKGIEIKNAFLRDPRIYDEHMRELRRWRDDFERTFIRRRINDPGHIMDFYRRTWDEISADVEEIRGALLNVERINEIHKVLDSLNERIGGDNIGDGIIYVPFDTRIDSVLASTGEYLAEGYPIVTARERFRCRAKAFITSQEVSAISLMPMSVWKIELNNNAEAAPNISYICIVRRVEPNDSNNWIIDMEIFAAIQPNIPGISNLPKFLPLSTRYLEPVIFGVTEEVLNKVEATLPILGTGTIMFTERVH